MHDEQRLEAGTGTPLERLLASPSEVLERIPDAVVAAAPDGRIVFVNRLAEELFGYSRDELVGSSVERLWPVRERERYRRNIALNFATEHPLRFASEARGLRRDGTEFEGEMSWGVIETTEGPLLLAVGRDISKRRAAEARVRGVAALGQRALAGTDPADLTAEAVRLLRATLPLAGVAIGLAGGAQISSDSIGPGATLELPLATGDVLVVAPTRALDDEEMSHLRAVAHTLSIALARLRAEDRIRHESVHDPLTGLANRILLQEQLQLALARSEREGTQTAVLFVDLDAFKQINDVYGHAIGDRVLTAVGARMRTAVRPSDTVARVGGDEFVVVCEAVDETAALALSKRLLAAISRPIELGGTTHTVSASIGVALGYCDPEMLLQMADSAGYRAKTGGRSRVELHR